MAGAGREPSRRVSGRALAAITFLLAQGGAAAVADVEEAARHGQGPVAGHVAQDGTLLLPTTEALAAAPVLPEPTPGTAPRSVAEVVDGLLAAHRAYVDADPDRFVAITHLASAAVFGRRELLAPLADRNRRTRATAHQHLLRLHDVGLVAQPRADLRSIARLLVDSATGIELCHKILPDSAVRDATYAELSRTIQDRLTRST
ncbi:MAG: hypothetical protein AAGC46_21250 [Solirubrobacteraceae bacterium]